MSTRARDPIEHRNLLCAHCLNKGQGLLRVLRAWALHKQKASSGLTKPGDAFKTPLWDVLQQEKRKKGDYQDAACLCDVFSLVFPMGFEDRPIFAGNRKGFASVHRIHESSTCAN